MTSPNNLVGINGQIESTFDRVFVFESAFFDSSYSNSSSNRISLENRWEAVMDPSKYLDNLVGNLDMFEYELKSFRDEGKTLVCLHSNKILLNGTKEFVDKFKEICKRYFEKFEFVLSMGMVGGHDASTEIESIVSHIHYGSSRGLFFGAIGPLLLDSAESVRVCVESHKRTNAPVFVYASSNQSYLSEFIHSIEDSSKVFLIIEKIEVWEYVSRHFIDKKFHVIIPCSTSDYRLKALTIPNALYSPGCSQKVHFKKFGGLGFDEDRYLLQSNRVNPFQLLGFAWSPPKLNGQQDDDYGKWVCDICGVRAKLSEQENFTKHGYTYCSVACLSSHRKRGFEPLT